MYNNKRTIYPTLDRHQSADGVHWDYEYTGSIILQASNSTHYIPSDPAEIAAGQTNGQCTDFNIYDYITNHTLGIFCIGRPLQTAYHHP